VAVKNFEDAKCKLFTLTDYPTVIEKAVAEKYVKKEDLDSLLEWKKDPANWRK
jgi:orotate phosphoribosyltransferase